MTAQVKLALPDGMNWMYSVDGEDWFPPGSDWPTTDGTAIGLRWDPRTVQTDLETAASTLLDQIRSYHRPPTHAGPEMTAQVKLALPDGMNWMYSVDGEDWFPPGSDWPTTDGTAIGLRWDPRTVQTDLETAASTLLDQIRSYHIVRDSDH